MFTVRSVLPLLGGLLVLALALPAHAQTLKPSRQSAGPGQAVSSEVINGVTYYYDANGNPLYYDDPVHYSPPKRFYWRNGGWVMASSGRGSVRSGGAIRSRGVRGIVTPRGSAGHPTTSAPHTETPAVKPAPAAPHNQGSVRQSKPAARQPTTPRHTDASASRAAPAVPHAEKSAAPKVAPAKAGSSGGAAAKGQPGAGQRPARHGPRGK